MSSVIALNQIDGRELWKKVGFKPSEKVLVALRGVYNLPFNLDDPVYLSNVHLSTSTINMIFPKILTTCPL